MRPFGFTGRLRLFTDGLTDRTLKMINVYRGPYALTDKNTPEAPLLAPNRLVAPKSEEGSPFTVPGSKPGNPTLGSRLFSTV